MSDDLIRRAWKVADTITEGICPPDAVCMDCQNHHLAAATIRDLIAALEAAEARARKARKDALREAADVAHEVSIECRGRGDGYGMLGALKARENTLALIDKEPRDDGRGC